MDWIAINSQADLDELDESVCWEDSESVEYYAVTGDESYYPPDVSRSGYIRKNIHILCRVCSGRKPYLELVCIACDWFLSSFLDNPHMRGHVDSLKRVAILDQRNDVDMQCSRIIYRFLDEDCVRFLRDGKQCRAQFSDAEPANE